MLANDAASFALIASSQFFNLCEGNICRKEGTRKQRFDCHIDLTAKQCTLI